MRDAEDDSGLYQACSLAFGGGKPVNPLLQVLYGFGFISTKHPQHLSLRRAAAQNP